MNVFDFEARSIDGGERSLDAYRGKVLLIVNTASKCGFTPQFEGLERLHEKYTARGLAVLGFPCNQFAAQDPGSDAEILSFCQTRYDVKFQMFAKVEVNGDAADPLYRFLKKEAPGVLGTAAIKWNFTKFLVDRDGKVLARFAPKDAPESIEDRIVALL